jgi:hypothetical protein
LPPTTGEEFDSLSEQDTRKVLITELDALEALARSTMEHLRETLSGAERDTALNEARALLARASALRVYADALR